VTREYYINDGGAQVDVLARSVYLRYLEAHGQEVAFEDGTYPGDYLVPVGEALKDKVGDAYDGPARGGLAAAEVRDFATERDDGADPRRSRALGVRDGRFFSEKSLYGTGRIEAALGALEGQGPDLRGRAGAAQGQDARGLGAARADAVRSTAHGDDVDRPVKKSDGGPGPISPPTSPITSTR
jgi:arginyl-tRNA synthetase